MVNNMVSTLHRDKAKQVYFGISDNVVYPTRENGYSPTKLYPEYIFKKNFSLVENQVYELVREGFYNLQYDQANYGTEKWNPLGSFIKEGDNVLIKPNWVMHFNKNKACSNNLDCLVTHPSVVRAVIDYVLIALKGTGRVIVADAPMQGCDLQELFSKAGYLELIEFYKNEGINLEILDLRHCRVITNNKVITDTIILNEGDQSQEVELGEASAHESNVNLQYKVSDYTAESTKKYHHNKIHTYKVNKNVLQADTIINMPKPKCHKLAGLTAAQKNMVGITYDKASLPHRTIGAKTFGGDEYPNKSIIKMLMSKIEERKIRLTENGKSTSAMGLQFIIAVLYVIVKVFYRDKVLIGSWYGNDTIWRTVFDLNLIAKYADKNGILRDKPQRRILNIADMIIAGQGNGPVSPTPKKLGMIIIAENSVAVDVLCADIMGFDSNKVPGLQRSMKYEPFQYDNNTLIVSNVKEYDGKHLHNFDLNSSWKFKPHDCWKGNIEI